MRRCRARPNHWLKREAAPGVDGMTWDAYGEGLEARLRDLESRVHKAPIGRSLACAPTSPSRTAGNGRSASLLWKTKSSSARW